MQHRTAAPARSSTHSTLWQNHITHPGWEYHDEWVRAHDGGDPDWLNTTGCVPRNRVWTPPISTDGASRWVYTASGKYGGRSVEAPHTRPSTNHKTDGERSDGAKDHTVGGVTSPLDCIEIWHEMMHGDVDAAHLIEELGSKDGFLVTSERWHVLGLYHLLSRGDGDLARIARGMVWYGGHDASKNHTRTGSTTEASVARARKLVVAHVKLV